MLCDISRHFEVDHLAFALECPYNKYIICDEVLKSCDIWGFQEWVISETDEEVSF